MQSRWNSFEEERGLRVRDFLAYERVMEANPFEERTGTSRPGRVSSGAGAGRWAFSGSSRSSSGR